jgi:hypothetical protein
VKNPRIVPQDGGLFTFEYDRSDEAEKLRTQKQFTYEGKNYKIKKVIEGMVIPTYYSFTVVAEPA